MRRRRNANAAGLAVSFLAGALVGTYAPSLMEALTAPFSQEGSGVISVKVVIVTDEKIKEKKLKVAR